MTKILVLSALFSIAASAQSAPTTQGATLLAKTIGSGAFVPAGVCDSGEISIYSDGRVVSTHCGKDAKLQLTLGTEKTNLLADMAKTAGDNGGKLVILDPSSPIFPDGGTTTISLMSAKGPVTIGGKKQGQDEALVWGDRMMHSEEVALRFIKAINQIVNAPFGK